MQAVLRSRYSIVMPFCESLDVLVLGLYVTNFVIYILLDRVLAGAAAPFQFPNIGDLLISLSFYFYGGIDKCCTQFFKSKGEEEELWFPKAQLHKRLRRRCLGMQQKASNSIYLTLLASSAAHARSFSVQAFCVPERVVIGTT